MKINEVQIEKDKIVFVNLFVKKAKLVVERNLERNYLMEGTMTGNSSYDGKMLEIKIANNVINVPYWSVFYNKNG